MDYIFNHEKLTVYQHSINFIAWLSSVINSLKNERNIKDQLDRASVSITLNIAEGNAKYSQKDRYRFFEIAIASAMECAAGLDVLVAKKQKTTKEIHEGKVLIHGIVSMLHGLRKSYGKSVREESMEYFQPATNNEIKNEKLD